MGSISNPLGPSISGYTNSMVYSEVSTTLDDYNAAKSTELIKYQEYQAALNAFATTADKNTALLNITNTKTAYLTALSELDTAAENYATALARQQIFIDAGRSTTISSTITSLGSRVNPPDSSFAGLTSTEYQQTLAADTVKESSRGVLLAAFNAYRYNEWQIAHTRMLILAQLAEQDAINTIRSTPQDPFSPFIYPDPFDPSTLNALNATLSVLLSVNRPDTTDALESALADYKATYQAVDDPLFVAISAARSQADNWSSYVAGEQAAALANIQATLDAAIAHDTLLNAARVSEFPNINTTYTNDLLAALAASHADAVSATIASGPGNVSTAVPSAPLLPKGNKTLSISQLMNLITQAQLMVDELSRQMNKADRRINALRRALGQLDLQYMLAQQVAINSWARIILSADLAYNKVVDEDNIQAFTQITNIYRAYHDNIQAINDAINQVNSTIDANTDNVNALVAAANTISSNARETIVAAYVNEPDTTNVLDYHNVEADMPAPAPIPAAESAAPITPIPHYPTIDSSITLAPVPQGDVTAQPPWFPDSASIDAMNASILELSNITSPIKDQVQGTLMQALSGSSTNFETLDLQELFLRPRIEPRNFLVLSAYDGFLSFLTAFSRQLSAMRTADAVRGEKPLKMFEALFQRIDQLIQDITPKQTSSSATSASAGSIGGGVLFSAADIKAKAGTIDLLLSQIASSQQFGQLFQNLFERLGIQSGLQAAGTLPEAAKHLSTLGIPIQELLGDRGVDVSAAIERGSNRALVIALLSQISAFATNIETLHENAIALLLGASPTAQLSAEEGKQVIAGLISLQQLTLLLLSVALASAAGFSAKEILAGFGKGGAVENALESILEKMGMPTGAARNLIGAIPGTADSWVGIMNKAALTGTQQLALLIVLGSGASERSLTQNVPGGRAFFDAIKSELGAAGIILPGNIFTPNLEERIRAQLDAKIQKLGAASSASNIAEVTASQFISPRQILAEIMKKYSALPAGLQQEIARSLSPGLASLPALSDQEKAALTAALVAKQATPSEIGALVTALQQHNGKPGLLGSENLTTDITKKLFQKTPEQLALEKENKQRNDLMNEILHSIKQPSTLPPDLHATMKRAFESTSQNFSDKTFADKALSSFVDSVQKLSSFNTVFLHYLLDPGRSILKEFSIITRSSGEKSQQSPIMLGG